MKTYIVFLAMMIAGLTALSYNTDMMSFVYEENLLKAVAEECASGAAMLQDEEAYSEGRTVFDREKGVKYADDHVEYVICRHSKGKSYDVSLEFEDDEKGYSTGNAACIPTVIATVSMECDDMFRLPFITVTGVTRKAAYELKGKEMY